jgi:AraC-like DNA-binding protein
MRGEFPSRIEGTLLHKWSTDQVEPQHRFDHWREVRARGLFGVTAELEPEWRPRFSGEFAVRKIGTASLIELHASPYRVERSAADIARAPGASLCIYQQLGGGGRFGVHDSGEFTLRPGSFATSHTDLPYRTGPLADGGFHLRILKVPAAGLITPHADLHDLIPKPFCSQPSLTPLLESCFADLTEAGDGGDPAITAPLVEALAQLALIERGLVRPASRAAMGAIRIGHLSLARRLITCHLSNPALSPAFVAELLGISVRHLYALFEATGMSFAQTVTAQRIGESRRLLKEAPERSISQIAFASGFESLATFYRAFQAAHGASPSDFRTQGNS